MRGCEGDEGGDDGRMGWDGTGRIEGERATRGERRAVPPRARNGQPCTHTRTHAPREAGWLGRRDEELRESCSCTRAKKVGQRVCNHTRGLVSLRGGPRRQRMRR